MRVGEIIEEVRKLREFLGEVFDRCSKLEEEEAADELAIRLLWRKVEELEERVASLEEQLGDVNVPAAVASLEKRVEDIELGG
ncbi:MAG: hypothetical protein ACXQTZ_00355 [Candidatus Alkanophagales archaeon]